MWSTFIPFLPLRWQDDHYILLYFCLALLHQAFLFLSLLEAPWVISHLSLETHDVTMSSIRASGCCHTTNIYTENPPPHPPTPLSIFFKLVQWSEV